MRENEKRLDMSFVNLGAIFLLVFTGMAEADSSSKARPGEVSKVFCADALGCSDLLKKVDPKLDCQFKPLGKTERSLEIDSKLFTGFKIKSKNCFFAAKPGTSFAAADFSIPNSCESGYEARGLEEDTVQFLAPPQNVYFLCVKSRSPRRASELRSYQ